MSELHLIKKFEAELTKVNGQCILFNNITDAVIQIQKFCEAKNIKRTVINTQLDISKAIFNDLKNRNFFVESTEDIMLKNKELKEELRDIELGISCANFLIAETGTVMLVSSKSEPRLLSLIPEFHIVLAKAESIVEKIEDALKIINIEACITLITGPSRTADIEKVLITGVHGPREFLVFIFTC